MAGYVSEAVIKRLPAYYRHLKELELEGVRQVSSQGLGERMGFTASQIRQDINCFGGFGRQGFGYSVPELRMHIGRIMGVDQPHRMIILGAGNIGSAVALSDSFPRNGFETIAIFDSSESKIKSEGQQFLQRFIPVYLGVLLQEEYADYFSEKDWYVPNPYFDESDFNDIEMYNKDFIVDYEAKRGWR